MQVSEDSELGVGSLQTRVTSSFETLDMGVEQILGPVQDQQVLLTADPFLQPLVSAPAPHFNLWFISYVSAGWSEDWITFCFHQFSWLSQHHTRAAFIPFAGSRCYLYCMLALHLWWLLFLDSIFPASLWCL